MFGVGEIGKEILGLAKTNDAKYIWTPRTTKMEANFSFTCCQAQTFVLRPCPSIPSTLHPCHPTICRCHWKLSIRNVNANLMLEKFA